MKKLILKCALLLFIVGSILYAGGAAYKQTNAYRNLERTDETEEYGGMPERIGIAVFGPSHGRTDFKVAPEGAVMFNFALNSQTSEYDLRLMRQYQDRIEPGALVVLTFTYLSPYWTDPEADFQSKQRRYYRILDSENIVDVDLSRYWTGRLCPLLLLEPGDIASAFLKPPPLAPTTDERIGHKRLSPEDLPEERARIERAHWNERIAPVYPEVNPVMWDAYRGILELCRERGWKAVLVTPPYTGDYNACFPAGFYEDFLSRAAELSDAYGVPYLDYSHDPAFAESYDLYRDIDHLNLDGAAVFNERFFPDVQALGLLGQAPR